MVLSPQDLPLRHKDSNIDFKNPDLIVSEYPSRSELNLQQESKNHGAET